MIKEHKTLECSWGNIHFVDFNENSQDKTILCIHGWLDNCSSFLPIAEKFSERLILLDLPGHGMSDHLPQGNWYHFVDYTVRLHEIISKLKLDKIHLMGHSMGAAISSMYAASFPELIESVILIDGLGPLVNDADDSCSILRESIINREKYKNSKKPIPNLDLAAKARMSNGTLDYNSAKILVENQTKQVNGSYYWTFDPKLKHTSSLRLTKEQLASFFKNIECPTLLIKATDSYIEEAPYWNDKELIKKLTVVEAQGNHHLHMDCPEQTFAIIRSFLNNL